jgi:hypothetical protein
MWTVILYGIHLTATLLGPRRITAACADVVRTACSLPGAALSSLRRVFVSGYRAVTGLVHLFGYLAVVYAISALVTGGDAASVPVYRPSPTAEYLLALTAQHAPVLHQRAVLSVSSYCTSTLGVEGVGRSYMRPDDAKHLAEALDIPFVGRAQALAHPNLKGNRLVILDTGAGIDICCDYTYVVPGTEQPCERNVAGVGGVITARVEADFIFQSS